MDELLEYVKLFAPGIIAGVAVALQCAILSPFVVLKKLAFLGQGVSHAAFGGIGLALALGLGAGATFGFVAGFCVLAGLLVAQLTDRRGASSDTVIGVVLVGAMALGAILIAEHGRAGGSAAVSWEAILFGSLLTVGAMDAWIAWIVGAGIALAALWMRRPATFWAFDESAAEAFGVSTGWVGSIVVGMIAVAIVVAMKLSGVVLATALLVLPGATALRFARTLVGAVWLSCAVSVIGMLSGLAGSFLLDWPPGACVVAALIVIYAAVRVTPARRLAAPPIAEE